MRKPKVLYVEDEPFLAQIVSDGLVSSGYEVFHETDGQLALNQFINQRTDICILDIMLPMKDGYTLAKDIRKINSNIPIIFLSAKTLTEDVIKGFKSGGNDYLKKPFSMDELLIRMESLLFRFRMIEEEEETPKVTIYEFGSCALDTVQQLLRTSTGIYSISFKETVLLELLLVHKNEILERETALFKIWGDNSYYNARSMDVFLTRLRKLVKDEPEIQLLNIRGIGYKLVCC